MAELKHFGLLNVRLWRYQRIILVRRTVFYDSQMSVDVKIDVLLKYTLRHRHKTIFNNEITNLSDLVGWIKYWFAVAALQCRVFPKLYIETRKNYNLSCTMNVKYFVLWSNLFLSNYLRNSVFYGVFISIIVWCGSETNWFNIYFVSMGWDKVSYLLRKTFWVYRLT